MTLEGSITVLLQQLKAGDPQAAHGLWQGYFARLVRLARSHLAGIPRAAADEEDVALSAFNNFCVAAQAAHFPRLDDRDDLWQVLLMLTARKAANLREHAVAQKRDAARGRHFSALAGSEEAPFDPSAREPDPAEAALLADEARRLLDLLGDDQLVSIAVWKMEGYTNEQIAEKIGRSIASAERKVRTIRQIWEQELPGPSVC